VHSEKEAQIEAARKKHAVAGEGAFVQLARVYTGSDPLLRGKEVELVLRPETTMLQIKEQILVHDGTSITHQRLLFKGKTLADDDATVADVGMDGTGTAVLSVVSQPMVAKVVTGSGCDFCFQSIGGICVRHLQKFLGRTEFDAIMSELAEEEPMECRCAGETDRLALDDASAQPAGATPLCSRSSSASDWSAWRVASAEQRPMSSAGCDEREWGADAAADRDAARPASADPSCFFSSRTPTSEGRVSTTASVHLRRDMEQKRVLMKGGIEPQGAYVKDGGRWKHLSEDAVAEIHRRREEQEFRDKMAARNAPPARAPPRTAPPPAARLTRKTLQPGCPMCDGAINGTCHRCLPVVVDGQLRPSGGSLHQAYAAALAKAEAARAAFAKRALEETWFEVGGAALGMCDEVEVLLQDGQWHAALLDNFRPATGVVQLSFPGTRITSVVAPWRRLALRLPSAGGAEPGSPAAPVRIPRVPAEGGAGGDAGGGDAAPLESTGRGDGAGGAPEGGAAEPGFRGAEPPEPGCAELAAALELAKGGSAGASGGPAAAAESDLERALLQEGERRAGARCGGGSCGSSRSGREGLDE
jgi:hypothetical protein